MTQNTAFDVAGEQEDGLPIFVGEHIVTVEIDGGDVLLHGIQNGILEVLIEPFLQGEVVFQTDTQLGK